MRITFTPEFLLHTNGCSEQCVKGDTVGACLETLFNRFPQLLAFFTAKQNAEAERTSIRLNGEYLFAPESLWLKVGEEDHLEFGRDIPEGESSGVKMIAGAVLLVAAVATGQAYLGATAYSMMVGMGASLVLGGISELIMGKPSVDTGLQSSSSTPSSFSGIRNTTSPTTAVPIVYGKHRVGGHLTNVYTQLSTGVVDMFRAPYFQITPDSTSVGGSAYTGDTTYLYAQLALSEGEIDSITDIELNKRSITGYTDNMALWRRGTTVQLPEEAKNTTNTEGIDTQVVSPLGSFPFELITNKPITELRLHLAVSTAPGTGITMRAQDVNNVDITTPVTLMSYGEYVMTRHVMTFGGLGGFSGKIRLTFTKVGGYPAVGLEKYETVNKNFASEDSGNEMAWFNKIENTWSVSQLLTEEGTPPQGSVVPTGGVQFTTQTETQEVRLAIKAPALYDNGNGTSVGFVVAYREEGSSAAYKKYNPDVSKDTYHQFSIKSSVATKNETWTNVPLALSASKFWDIVVYRVGKPSTSLNTFNDIYLDSVTESAPGGHIYPHTALLGVKIKATDQLSGSMPTITSLVKGVKVAVPKNYDGTNRDFPGAPWDGTLDEVNRQWTDNPVWCLYDLITNKRYGLGNYFKISPAKKGLMLWNFKEMADYCDERLTDDGDAPVTNTTFSFTLFGERFRNTSTEASRHRFSLNLIIDESKTALEWINTICASMRASFFYTEGCVYLDIDRPKSVTQLFTMSSIRDYTQSRASRSGVPNTYEVQFVDQDKNYEPALFTVEDSEFQQDRTIEQRSKSLQLRGVTDIKQVKSLAKYALYGGKHARTLVTFKTGAQGLFSMIGDVIAVQHDVPKWGAGGRILEVGRWSGGKYPITVSEGVTMTTGVSYSMNIARAGMPPEIVAVVTPGTTVTTRVLLIQAPLTLEPAAGDEYIIGEASNAIKKFKIVALKRDVEEQVEVSAIEYNESLYAACDNIVDAGGVEAPLYQQLPEPKQQSVKNFKVEKKVYTDSAGVLKTGAVVTYTKPTENNWRGATVRYGVLDYNIPTQVNNTGYLFIPELFGTGMYTFAALSEYTDGTRQSLDVALADAFDHPFGSLYITPPVDIQMAGYYPGLTGLSIQDMANDGTFTGKDCVITWNTPLLSPR